MPGWPAWWRHGSGPGPRPAPWPVATGLLVVTEREQPYSASVLNISAMSFRDELPR
ncbi:MAG TPA: hypothetical protein VN645_13735 [Steroidobacteraceae bacterium]|nr:hypothetical protein [Steroidobacteraceae bacterium]